jgi:hypothetical protein
MAINGFRTYDPFAGGYLQVDPLVPETWSSYGYCQSNPVGNIDPTGKMSFSEMTVRWALHILLTDGYSCADVPESMEGEACGFGFGGGGGGGGGGDGPGGFGVPFPIPDYCEPCRYAALRSPPETPEPWIAFCEALPWPIPAATCRKLWWKNVAAKTAWCEWYACDSFRLGDYGHTRTLGEDRWNQLHREP